LQDFLVLPDCRVFQEREDLSEIQDHPESVFRVPQANREAVDLRVIRAIVDHKDSQGNRDFKDFLDRPGLQA